jgi:MYXO-CTERM domain-containing protein
MLRAVYLSVVCALWAMPLRASASPNFPAVLSDELSLGCEPSCLLCHTKLEGGFATANTPFGVSVRKAGLLCCEDSQITDVLAMLSAQRTDSDEDGQPDVDELAALSDPNAAEDELACTEPPPAKANDSGCQAGLAGNGPRGLGGLAVLMLLGLLRRRTSAP